MTYKSPITSFRNDNGKMSLQAFGLLFSPPVTKATVFRWELGRISAQRAIEIEKVTGISRSDLLPDIFSNVPPNTAP